MLEPDTYGHAAPIALMAIAVLAVLVAAFEWLAVGRSLRERQGTGSAWPIETRRHLQLAAYSTAAAIFLAIAARLVEVVR